MTSRRLAWFFVYIRNASNYLVFIVLSLFLHVISFIIAWTLSCLLPALCGIQKNRKNGIGQLPNIT